jgi:hypothetical protein
LLLPAGLWQRLTDKQQETLLIHELAHLRRRDHWVRRLELLVLGLYWWHPVVWWARWELQEAEEQCCDAWVVWALPAAAEAYATALIETVAFLSFPRSALPAGASGIGQTHCLKRRLTMILQGTTRRALTWGALLTLLACGAALLPLRPTWAQTGPASPPVEPKRAAPGGGVLAQLPAVEGPAGSGLPERPRVVERGRATGEVSVCPAPVALHRPEDVDDAKDEVELLKAQLDAKKAELQEAEVLLDKVARQLARHEKLSGSGVASVEDLDQLRSDVAVQKARLRVKQAQTREAELRLRQAERHLSRLQSRPAASGDSILRPGQPAGGIGTAPPGYNPYPMQPQGIKPGGADVGSGKGRPPAPGGVPEDDYRRTATPRDSEQRLRELEKKIDALLKEVDALKREMKPKKPAD